MARRRMFSLDVVDTDRFLDMPSSTQALYFHLGMRADDDGFVASPKRTAAMCGCSADDLNLLAAKGFVRPFESGVLVIVDWRKNNQIRPDRYTPTQFLEEKGQFGIPAVNQTETKTTYQRVPQYRAVKGSIVESSLKGESEADKPPRPRFSPPSERRPVKPLFQPRLAHRQRKCRRPHAGRGSARPGSRTSVYSGRGAHIQRPNPRRAG